MSVDKIIYLYKVCVCGLQRLKGVCGSDSLPGFFLSFLFFFSLKKAKYVDMDFFFQVGASCVLN